MEGLTKQQLVLLALLVSFVTSIATGIVTVSLLERAPKAVTQTINRIVERTVERVVPAENQKASVVTKETVVVRSDDLAVAAIEKNTASIARIKRVEGVGDKRNEVLVGLGIVVSKDGMIAADASVMNRQFDEFGSPIPRSFLAVFAGARIEELKFVGIDDEAGIALFSVMPSEGMKFDVASVEFGDSDALKLGQTVISLGGEKDNAVSTGIVANLARRDAPDKAVTAIYTDREAASIVSGATLVNLSGYVVGISAGSFRVEKNRYVPSNVLKSAITRIKTASQ
ncbi:MAG: hypothetical protein A3C08_01060 [Candidatus Taylorbacteria bacterium RIFCSPHIGHO2_02_FULL_47_18]|uniref:Serine protease n=1 Tax=Candidatus Taylorbacteria bacterium RIFCSPLOWO2_01_FULL_48_100 TaxID=1802322 RepID=A0A1G2NI52_9BACT|nr:MAG: hypothetical protein A2670_00370 [Candidatus Taylorbacteria bacterium RIFCSPHIGHO2_01_FULL_48_38]OHA28275.1 MAG: hypothetical protein A3C08_01060 [Candidatus Taylorbacteria bacterium RIFCSPHIGHO2_02_FULL_47_18]OHA35071.1 MAG: hypothetical protein A2938_00685 [Candidatus Taylorbacteria bacterium RIFCSPLOWO2_01_FULL_48_100]OHA40602.1 MAG: hypothetical protein A3J31_02245 [Candidatus Taylorbacteria bacterium RIFCSPLOWO2_02_FULL_48_16]OHA44754.1 MAG: hypothetical protein A3H13_00505 [Candid